MPDTPRRQRRGLERMEQILDAATRVIGEVGYERATTNAIAAEADISPGSLYQYFADKAAIATALWERYAAGLRTAQTTAGFDPVSAPLEEVVDRMTRPALEFKREHAAFTALLSQADVPGGLAAVERAHADFEHEVTDVLARRNAERDRREVEASAAMVFALFRGVVTSASVTGDPDADARELTTAIVAYLTARGLR